MTTPPRRALSLSMLFAAVTALFVSLLAVVPGTAAADPGEPITATGLTTNGRVNPLGIPGEDPILGWVSTSPDRGVVQSAYEVRVGTTAGGADVWAPGRIDSDEQVDVVYGGPDLTSATRYHWQVRVWDGEGQVSDWSDPAWFETGLLDAAEWDGAEWIGHQTPDPMADWTNYTAEFDFSIQRWAFAALVRANGVRNTLMWQVSVADGTPRLRPHRRVNGTFTLLENIDISDVVSVEELTSGRHQLSVTVSQGSNATSTRVVTRLNDVEVDDREVTNTGNLQRGYVGFRGSQNLNIPERFTAHRVLVTRADQRVLLDTDFTGGNPFNGGTLVDGGLQVTGSSTELIWQPPAPGLPLLRTEFATQADKTVESARVYAAARGVYELSLNGERVGDQQLAPEWTDYRTSIHHQTYDVTAEVESGQNAFGAELGNGWWAGRIAHYPAGQLIYGNSVDVVAQLRITYTDGSTQVVDTGSDWRTHAGPYLAADLIDGETYDARAEQPGWRATGFDDAAWQPGRVATSATALLAPQPHDPVRAVEELSAIERTEPTPGHHLFDVGQNMVGTARMRLQGVAGQTVRIRYGEEVYRTGPRTGELYTENLRSAKATDYYTFKTTGTVVYEPKFTFHGFRYLEITGTTTAPSLDDVTGVVWGSDLRQTGEFETSDAGLNQLQSNITWGQRGNFVSVPTDTPARDERLGWTGDINVFAPTASFNTDTRAFLRKWLDDLRVTQLPNGDLPGIAPEPVPGSCCGGAVGWSDAMITVPYALFSAYSDRQVVRENYDAMKRYFAFARSANGGALIKNRGGYLDWLHLDDATPATVLATAYYAENARMLSEMAAAVGDAAYATELAEISTDVREAFANQLVAANGTVTGNSQAGYAMALGMDLVREDQREAVARRYVAKLEASGNHLRTGFLGTPWLLPGLSGAGQQEKAFELMMRKEMPSWLFEVEMGATTMWERWDSIRTDGGFGAVSMNSFNHYAFGAVGDWMYQNIAGLQSLEPGYKRSRIAPLEGGGLTSARGSLKTVHGTLSSAWERTDDRFDLEVEVPVNTTAEVVIPANSVYAVLESGRLVADADGVQDVEYAEGAVTVTVGSGSYSFSTLDDLGALASILERIESVGDVVAGHAEAGDLDEEARAALGTALSEIEEPVTRALEASVDGDTAAVRERLAAALTRVRQARAWLAGSSVDQPVSADIDRGLAGLEELLGGAVARTNGVSVMLVPLTESVRPGQPVTGTIQVANSGTETVTGLRAALTVAGWRIDDSEATIASLAPGETTQLQVTSVVPQRQAPGPVTADLGIALTVDGASVAWSSSTTWATVASDLAVTEISGAHPVGDDELAEVTVTVSNTGAAPAYGQVAVSLAEEIAASWADTVPSRHQMVPAGGSAEFTVPLFVPRRVIGGAVPVSAVFRADGITYAEADGQLTVDLGVPDAADVLDYIDFGDAASESAHAVQGSAQGSTSTEAGFTRRYSHANFPGSWFSAQVTAPAGEPFVGRIRETYDGPKTKKYNVYVIEDGSEKLATQLLVPRAESGAGTKMHQFVIDDPELLDHDGTFRLKFEYPLDGVGFHDPSIADLWLLPTGVDVLAPLVGSEQISSTPGEQGWNRGPVAVTLQAADNRDPAPVVEHGDDQGWAGYDSALTVDGNGVHEVSSRVTDATGNRSEVVTEQVRIDATAPATTLRPGDVAGSGRSVAVTAEDEHSGVATTFHRIDGGPWSRVEEEGTLTVSGFGSHTVEYFSVDIAGNAEVLQSNLIEVSRPGTDLAPAPRATTRPSVAGPARVGRVLQVNPGRWDVAGVTFGYQWLRSGRPIPGATGARHTLTRADVGGRLAVRVTALREGHHQGVADAAATRPVLPALSRTRVRVGKSTIRRGEPIRVRVRVKATGREVASGWVVVRVGGTKLAQARLNRAGVATVKVRPQMRGAQQIRVVYRGPKGIRNSRGKAAITVR